MKECAMPQFAPTRYMWRVQQSFASHRWGAGGPPPGIFFANLSSEKGIMVQFSIVLGIGLKNKIDSRFTFRSINRIGSDDRNMWKDYHISRGKIVIFHIIYNINI